MSPGTAVFATAVLATTSVPRGTAVLTKDLRRQERPFLCNGRSCYKICVARNGRFDTRSVSPGTAVFATAVLATRSVSLGTDFDALVRHR